MPDRMLDAKSTWKELGGAPVQGAEPILSARPTSSPAFSPTPFLQLSFLPFAAFSTTNEPRQFARFSRAEMRNRLDLCRKFREDHITVA